MYFFIALAKFAYMCTHTHTRFSAKYHYESIPEIICLYQLYFVAEINTMIETTFGRNNLFGFISSGWNLKKWQGRHDNKEQS